MLGTVYRTGVSYRAYMRGEPAGDVQLLGVGRWRAPFCPEDAWDVKAAVRGPVAKIDAGTASGADATLLTSAPLRLRSTRNARQASAEEALRLKEAAWLALRAALQRKERAGTLEAETNLSFTTDAFLDRLRSSDRIEVDARVADLDGDGKLELFGAVNFGAPSEGSDDLDFGVTLIAALGASPSDPPLFVDVRGGAGYQIFRYNVANIVDLDADGVDEILLSFTAWENFGYRWLQKTGSTWQLTRAGYSAVCTWSFEGN
jgi:hypothetical protein